MYYYFFKLCLKKKEKKKWKKNRRNLDEKKISYTLLAIELNYFKNNSRY